MTVLYCQSVPFLKLGPGPRLGEEHVVSFIHGFAEIDNDDPHHDEKVSWATTPGTPPIENLGDNAEERAAVGDGPSLECAVCGKSFASQRALNGHLMSHRPKK